MPDLVPIRVRDCACPDSPHAEEGDIVYLARKVSLDLGVACQQALSESGGDTSLLTRLWMTAFVRYGARGANFLDPFDPEALLEDFELSGPVAEAANDLYAEVLLRPLGLSPSKSSAGGRTAGSTSRTRRSHRVSPRSS
jgi:hypothetical protein